MKVICITNKTLSGKKVSGLTIGKIYDVITLHSGNMWLVKILDDNNQELWYNDEVVISLDKWRESQLNKLKID
jgi:hypothetical protein